MKRLCDEARIGFALEQNARGFVARFGHPDWQREYAQRKDKSVNKPNNNLDNNAKLTKETAGRAFVDTVMPSFVEEQPDKKTDNNRARRAALSEQ